MDNWLTVGDVSGSLKVSEETVRRWARAGLLRGIKTSRRGDWRFRRKDLDGFVSGLVPRLPGRPSAPPIQPTRRQDKRR